MGLSAGAIAGIVIGSCVVVLGILLVMCWVMPGSKNGEKRQKSTAKREDSRGGLETGQAQSRQSLGRSVSVVDGKDHFFKNLIPSFIKRDAK